MQAARLFGIPDAAVTAGEDRKFLRIPAAAAGTESGGQRFRCERSRRTAVLTKKIGPAMSPILPISLFITVLCIFGAIDGVLYQQLLFVGAAIAATILVCSFEAWSAREAPAPREDERRLRHPTDR
jgi:hypothetical protein